MNILPMLTLPDADVSPILTIHAPAALPKKLTEKHRPTRFALVRGQDKAVATLRDFVAQPFSTSFIFEGDTGTGKTTLAKCLANEIGADEEWGVMEINAGEQDGEAVENALRMLRQGCFGTGSGWKVIIVNEADYMSKKAEYLWLSALESIQADYNRSVVVFTTNYAGKLDARFTDRCSTVTFQSDGGELMPDIQTVLDEIWSKEGAAGVAPWAALMAGLTDKNGRVSFRRAIKLLEPYLKAARSGIPYDAPVPAAAAAAPAPTARKVKPAPAPAAPAPIAAEIVNTAAPAILADADTFDWNALAARWHRGELFSTILRETGLKDGVASRKMREAGVVFPKRGEKRVILTD